MNCELCHEPFEGHVVLDMVTDRGATIVYATMVFCATPFWEAITNLPEYNIGD